MVDWNTVYEYCKTAVLENQFAQGGLVIGVLTGVLFYGRQALSALKTWFLRKTTMKLEILSGEDAFDWCQFWLAQSKFGQKTQTLMVRNDKNGVAQLLPGTGRHIFFYKKRVFFLWNIVEPIKADGMLMGYQRSVVIHVVPGNRKIGEEFIRETEQVYNELHKSKIKVYATSIWGESWCGQAPVRKRGIESVILKTDTRQAIINDITDFKNSRERYNSLNIPWRRGYLLHGKPGNGKSSLALAIASTFNYSLYVLQLSGISSDEKLKALCGNIPENAVLLFEDVDCHAALKRRDANVNEEEIDNSGITLSGMLNVLDGVTSGEGRIVIMTSNHPDKLDPALIRPGRADFQIEISTPDRYQVETMFERFYGDRKLAVKFAEDIDYNRLCMAQLQVYFLKHKTPQEAIANRKYLLDEERQTTTDTVQGMGLDGAIAVAEDCNILAGTSQGLQIRGENTMVQTGSGSELPHHDLLRQSFGL